MYFNKELEKRHKYRIEHFIYENLLKGKTRPIEESNLKIFCNYFKTFISKKRNEIINYQQKGIYLLKRK